jgi:hypothetical protein
MTNYSTIRYAGAAEAARNYPYQTGTATSSGSNRLLDISTGNAFDIGVAGANILYLNNVTGPIDLTVKVAATQGVVGGYNLDSNATVDTTEVFSYSWSTNTGLLGSPSGGLSFSPDGTKMFVNCIGSNMNLIGQFSLSTAWDPSTANTSPDYQYGYGSSYLKNYNGHYWDKGGKTVTQFLTTGSDTSWWSTHMTTPYDLSTYTTTSQSTTLTRPESPYLGATSARTMTSHIIDDPDSENDWWFYVDKSRNLRRISYNSSSATVQSSTINTVFGVDNDPHSIYVSPDGTILTVLFTTTMRARSVIMSTPFDMTTAGTPTEYDLNSDILTTNTSTNWFADLAPNDDGSKIFALRMYKGQFKIHEITPNATITPPSLTFNSNHTPISGSANISLSHNSNAVFKIKSLTSDASEVTVLQAATGGGGNAVTIWKSAPVTNSTYGAYAAHGQGIAADKVWVEMTCTTAQLGWAVGDIVYKYQAQYSSTAQLTMYSDATDIGYRQDQIDAIMDSAYGPDTNSTSYARLAEANWEIRICGAWYDSSVVTQAT